MTSAPGPLGARRVLVIGASSGIGYAIAQAVDAAGGRVAIAARRVANLDDLAATLNDPTSVPMDVRDEGSITEGITTVVSEFGGLDALVYAAGISPLREFGDADAALWHDALATNVVGAALAARACLSHLQESGGRLVVLSSNSVERPFPGLGLYAVSKAALDEFAFAWRGDHPDVPITRVVVGPTSTAGMAAGWEPDLAGRLGQRWVSEGYLDPTLGLQEPSAVASAVVGVLAATNDVTDIRLMPRRP